jgi:drug/metabolite transporter (DMT)-like permease
MIFLLLSIIASTITVSYFKVFEKLGVHTLTGIVFNYLACAILGNFVGVSDAVFSTPFWTMEWFPYTVFLGFMFITIFFAIGKTVQQMGVSVSMVSAKLSVVVPILFAVSMYSENVKYMQLIGIVLSLIAVYFISKKDQSEKTQNKNLWILPLIVFMGSGIIDTTLKIIQTHFIPPHSEAHIITITFTMAFVFGIFVLIYDVIKNNLKITIKNIFWGFMLGIPNYFSMYFLLKTLAAFHDTSTVVFPVNNIGILAASSLVSIVFFKEKMNKLNWYGLMLSVISIVLISEVYLAIF